MTAPVVIGASIAQRIGKGGHAWALLQWVLGLQRLGHDVVLLDRLDASMCTDDRGVTRDLVDHVRWLTDVVDQVGLGERFSLVVEGQHVGLPQDEVAARLRDGVLLDINGFAGDDLLGHAARHVYLDIDPGFGQLWHELGLYEPFAGYDDVVTVGTNVGGPGSTVPTLGLDWLTTLPPVVLERWPYLPPTGRAFTSVASWRGPFAPVEVDGRVLGLRVHEMRRLVDLPSRSGQRFELALDIDPADAVDRDRLVAGGWELSEPADVAGDLDTYRRWIARSGAELCVAKQLYVATSGGWFSDRSACYLATGRPVVAQSTGFEVALPTGKGLLAFSSPDEAEAAVAEVAADWEGHARAARSIAEEHLDSDLVLGRLTRRLGLG